MIDVQTSRLRNAEKGIRTVKHIGNEYYGGTITYPFSVNVVLEIWLLKRKEIDMEIKNVGQLRKIIENIPDDYEIEMRVRCELSDEELKGCRYPYPYDTEYLTLEFDDIGVSCKVLCLGVTSKTN